MNDKRIETKHENRGLLATVIESAGMIGEKTVTLNFGLLRDVRAEINQRTLGVIDAVEGAQQSTTRLLRSVNQRVDELVNTVIDSGERIGLAMVQTMSTTGSGAVELASRTASSLTSTRAAVGGDRLSAAGTP